MALDQRHVDAYPPASFTENNKLRHDADEIREKVRQGLMPPGSLHGAPSSSSSSSYFSSTIPVPSPAPTPAATDDGDPDATSAPGVEVDPPHPVQKEPVAATQWAECEKCEKW